MQRPSALIILLLFLTAPASPLRAQQFKQGGWPMNFEYRDFKKAGREKSGQYFLSCQLMRSKDAIGQLLSDFQHINIDMQQLNPSNPGEGYLLVQMNKFSIADGYQVVARPGWVEYPKFVDLANPVNDVYIPYGAAENANRVRYLFRIQGNGSGIIKIYIDCIPKDSSVFSATRFSVPLIMELSVRNYMDPSCQKWEVAKRSQAPEQWCQILVQHPEGACNSEIRSELTVQEDRLWDSARGNPSMSKDQRVNLLQIFINSVKKWVGYTPRHLGEAEKMLAELTKTPVPPPPPPPTTTTVTVPECQKQWNALRNNPNVEGLRNYIAQYGADPQCAKFVEEARDKLSSIEPLHVELSIQGSKARIFIKNAAGIEPKYKNVSATDGIDIEGAGFAQNGELNIRFKKPGVYEIYIRDKNGRDTILQLRNTFNAEVFARAEGWQLVVSGGKPPYFVELVDIKTNQVAHKMSMGKDSLLITRESLDLKNLHSEYSIRVLSRNQQEPIVAQGGTIQLEQKNLRLAWIAAGSLAFTAFLVGIYLLLSRLRARRVRPQQNVQSIRVR